MNNYEQILELLKSGIKPTVKIIKPFHEDDYLEAGMLARIQSLVVEDLDLIRVYLEFSEFQKLNIQFETPTWRMANGKSGTCREAGLYPKDSKDYVYACLDDFENCVEIVEMNPLFVEYSKARGFLGYPIPYVSWLEKKVLSLVQGAVDDSKPDNSM